MLWVLYSLLSAFGNATADNSILNNEIPPFLEWWNELCSKTT